MKVFLLIMALAACGESDAANFVQNPNFDVDIAGWEISGSCFAPVWDSFGIPPNGALAIDCFNQSTVETIRQCVAVSSTNVDFSAQATDDGIPGPVSFGLKAFASQNCSGAATSLLDSVDATIVPTGGCCGTVWTPISRNNLSAPAGTESVLVEITVQAQADIAIDNIQLSPSTIFQNGFGIAGYVSGNWYNVDQSGSGFQFEATNSVDGATGLPIMVAIWFTYTPDGNGQNWIIAQGDYDRTKNTVTLPAFLPMGGKFPPLYKSSDVTIKPWGTLTLSFADCDNGTASWNSTLPGYGSGSFPIRRITEIDGAACPRAAANDTHAPLSSKHVVK